ncbi:hypothetical protein [Peribacillus frigoritolerans]|uniref:hypothetical protein n=1 Tax=Peribacillus frigoritolerans TaxID=450367 RepID=UPI00207ADF5A|nr:hypothetical protein [Peribacillus frigoritolerans]USK77837.1 hypothetical protein LIT31_26285 [Peribacillus frigoritolerans]USK77915.1 hypothetical protein LIT31_26920 [Peribacillus frigoritolerans]
MEKTINTLDLNKFIGTVTLSDGVTVLNIPKLSVLKLIQIVKWLGVDGSKIYNQFQDLIEDESLDDLQKFATILEGLDEKQLVKLFSIALDLSPEETLNLDPNELLEILIVYADKLDLGKTYSLARELYKKIFRKELPNIKGALNSFVEKRMQAQQEVLRSPIAGEN